MGQAGNTVGLDTTSAAIARGEVGANYSRYSTGNLAALATAAGIGGNANTPANSGNRMSQSYGHANRSSMAGSIGGSAGGLHTPFGDDNNIQVEMDNLPQTMYAGNTTGLSSSPGFPLNSGMGGRSRFSEYGLNDAASSSESPSFRDSAVFDSSNRHDSIYAAGGKSMEDTSLLWNEKNVEADE